MKRSHLVSELSKLLKENFDKKYVDVKYAVVADYIVNMCETVGMKPPIHTKDPILLRDTYEWEKE